MRKSIVFLAIIAISLFISSVCFAQATAVLRQGDFIDQYKIDDPGNPSGFDNRILYLSHQVSEIVVQMTGVNYATYSETLGCWSDHEEPCPTVETAPTLFFLDSIMAAGGVSVGADLTELQEKAVYLAFWHEYKMKKMATDSLAEMDLEGMNDLQKRRALKYIYFGHGVDLATAQSIANDRVISGTVAHYVDYGLATVPLQDRRLLKLFGEVGWFEE